VTGLVMTAALLGFAVAGLLHEGDPQRTLRRAMWLTILGSVAAAFSPHFLVLLGARALEGVGVGMLVAGALVEVQRRLPSAQAARVNGAFIAGTAMGGLGGRAAGYTGLFLGWRGAFLVGAAATLLLVGVTLRWLGRDAGGPASRPGGAGPGRVPVSLLVAGLFILFVNVGLFDLLPYRLTGPAFHLSPRLADLVYLVYVLGSASGFVTGLAVARWGARVVIVAVAAWGVAALLVLLSDVLPIAIVGAAGAITATTGLHSAHSGWAARYGRAAVGRYLTIYYVGGAAAAPLTAFTFQRWGWPGVILPLAAAWALVGLLALARKQPDRPQREQPQAGLPPPGGAG
jgi:MFS transporter, YNFM family, putative membrane transport protein